MIYLKSWSGFLKKLKKRELKLGKFWYMLGSVNSVYFIDIVCNVFYVINKMIFCFNWRSFGWGGCLFRDIFGNLRELVYFY